jgi:hypothetical protein
MTDLEKIIELYTKKIQVSIPCKIEKISGMYADVKPLIFDDLDFPVISSVPILYIGNSSKKLKFKSSIGDIVTVFFTQLDLGKFLSTGATGQVNSTESFNLTNAFALPFNIHSKSDNETIATADFELIGNVDMTGNLDIVGNLNVTGTIDATGEIHSDVDVTAGGISLKTHTHQYNPGPGSPTPTGPSQ